MIDDALLRVEGLEVHLADRDGLRVVRAVNGVDFTLARGETVGIVGESGCGKSMTAMSLMRLLPASARIVDGAVSFAGEDLLAKSEAEMRRLRGQQIAMILQDPMVSLDPLYRIGDQMAEPLRIHKSMSGTALRSKLEALLRAVGISSPERRLRQYPHQMSGGMLQRIVGATAMSCDPLLLIADEPTTALDPTVQAQFLDLLDELKQRTGLSFLIITHDFGVAARLCDRVLVMYAGRIVEQAPVREIFDNPRHPYTQALLSTVPGRQHASGRRLRTIEGQPPDLADLPPGCSFAARCPKAQQRCHAEAPPELRLGDRHTVRCWYAMS